MTTNAYLDSLVISFSQPQASVGLGILSTLGNDVEIDAYSAQGKLLGSLVETPPIAGAGQFLGLIGTLGDRIGSVVLSTPFAPSTALESVLVDRVLFSVPEPSSLSMVGLAAGGLTGYAARRSGKSRRAACS